LYRRTVHLTEPESPPESDAVLAHKVESELFQAVDIESGRINVNAENGVVVLRGALERPEQIKEVEAAVRAIEGVGEVDSLLHLQGTPAPSRR
jgi:osmotically-inducible protein OsmY